MRLNLFLFPLTQLIAASAGQVSPAVACELEVAASVTAGEPVAVRFVLENRGSAELLVLRWHTPLEGWRSDLFEVTFDGRELPYQGPMAKRGDPKRSDYLELAAGGTLRAEVDLALAYDLSRPGPYRILLRRGLLDHSRDAAALPRPRASFEPLDLDCPTVAIAVHPPES
ncbi:MAG: hypothetical protein MI919_06365 [Holophagales bacterium]|nr:hypothetical protein [Holophagales bacterium]